MIKPTVGQIVWFWPGSEDKLVLEQKMMQPWAAIIVHVWSDTCVNLTTFDANGIVRSRTSVSLYQGEGPKPESRYCERVPDQVEPHVPERIQGLETQD